LSGLEAAMEAAIPNLRLCVWSRASSAAIPVTSIRGGDVLDVQRRRRDALTENYQSVAYP